MIRIGGRRVILVFRVASLWLQLSHCNIVTLFPRGLTARISGFHPGGPGSTPGVGTLFPRGLMARISSSLSLSSLLLDDDDDDVHPHLKSHH